MFERYTEAARRTIFFARYEASLLGSRTIEPEHLLLGLMRRDTKPFHFLVSPDGIASIRKQIESSATMGERISTSIDLPLSQDSKHALKYACEEAEDLGHHNIDTHHLLLGLLHLEASLAVKVLEPHGVSLTSYRDALRTSPPSKLQEDVAFWAKESALGRMREDAAPKVPAAASLRAPIRALDHLLDHLVENVNPTLDDYGDDYGRQRLKRKPWTRKEGMGHLINLAAVHHQWLASSLVEPKLTVAGYPADEWVPAQQYQDYSWPELLDLWIGLNRLLLHVLHVIPEEKTTMPCRIGVEDPITLLDLIERYVRHCENILGQILARL